MNKPCYDLNNPHIMTFTGKRFYYLDIKPDDICIEDIAHALSNTCRYNGHCKQFYCPTMDQRILTEDLRWIPAGDLVVGSKLVGFDEYPIIPGAAGKRRRRFRPSIVTNTQKIKRQIFRIETEDGRTVCASAEHPWLIATKQSRNQIWCTSDKISKAVSEGRDRYMHIFLDPWETIDTRDAGWLAGMFDGEGYLSIHNRGGIQCGVSQKLGLISDRLQELLIQFGFDYYTSLTGTSTYTYLPRGGFRNILRLLGSIRPHRLLNTFTTALTTGEFVKQFGSKGPLKKIIKVYDEGVQWVAGIETDTHTYLCEGFGAHNSVAEHSILCCDRGSNWLCQIWGLLHDAAEAYIGDLVSPFKHRLLFEYSGYNCEVSDYEDYIIRAIAEKIGIPYPIPEEVHKADRALLYMEMEFLWGDKPRVVMLPEEAERIFLSYFRNLMDKRWQLSDKI